MKRIITVLAVILVLALAGWFGSESLEDGQPLAEAPILSRLTAEDLPDTPDEWEGRIDYPALEQQLAELSLRPEMAGLAVAVVEDGRLSFVRTYGFADRSTGAVVSPQTVFRWASVSKTAAGALAASLADEGAVDLDKPITSWRTSLRLPNGAESQLTFGQLLSQQTGLTKNAYDERLEDGQNPARIRTDLFAAPLQCQPGTCHTYQNIAFDAASEILGQVADRPFPEAVVDRFFRPLGMRSAGYGMKGLTGAKEWARPHNNGQVREVKEAYWRVPAAAGVDSNIVDFAKWMQAMMGEKPDVLPVSVLQIAQSPRVATQRLYSGDLARALSDAGYGLGWRSVVYDGHVLAGHSGAVAGYRATMIFEPATRTGVVAMWNSNWGFPFRIPFAVIDSYHNKQDSNWLDLSELPPAKTEEPERLQ